MATLFPEKASRAGRGGAMANIQVRLGLVFEGGVSLAVWMSGVAHEIDLLRRAGIPGRVGASEHPDVQRWRGLCDKLERDVIVDVVAGTSAGGINGALLACAVAAGNRMPMLRDLWVEHAQLTRGRLLREDGKDPLPSLLDGQFFSRRLEEVFSKALAPGNPPSSHPVTLLTTATALGEQAKTFTDCYGGKFNVADHRRVYRFRHDPEAVEFRPPTGPLPTKPFTLFTKTPRADLADGKSATLAHAARATAGYPAAFEPVEEHAAFPSLGAFRFPRPSHDSSWLIDGGVLDNAPFEPLLREMALPALPCASPDTRRPKSHGAGHPSSSARCGWPRRRHSVSGYRP
jgi:patatin-related protein